ncbi:MAG: hypothetical protein ACYC7D_13460 [Nitrososphaerales archaeon]
MVHLLWAIDSNTFSSIISRRKMGFMAEAIMQIRMNNYGHASRILLAQLSDPKLKQSSKIILMEWIGECLSKAGEREKAATWFEKAARSTLDCAEISRFDKRQRALNDIEKAFEGYSSENDYNGIKRVALIKHSLTDEEWYVHSTKVEY